MTGSDKDHVTNEKVRAKIQQATGPHEDLLTTVKRRKLQWYSHVSIRSGKSHLARHSERGEEDKADRGRDVVTSENGQAWSSPGPSGEQRKLEDTSCEIM